MWAGHTELTDLSIKGLASDNSHKLAIMSNSLVHREVISVYYTNGSPIPSSFQYEGDPHCMSSK